MKARRLGDGTSLSMSYQQIAAVLSGTGSVSNLFRWRADSFSEIAKAMAREGEVLDSIRTALEELHAKSVSIVPEDEFAHADEVGTWRKPATASPILFDRMSVCHTSLDKQGQPQTTTAQAVS